MQLEPVEPNGSVLQPPRQVAAGVGNELVVGVLTSFARRQMSKLRDQPVAGVVKIFDPALTRLAAIEVLGDKLPPIRGQLADRESLERVAIGARGSCHGRP